MNFDELLHLIGDEPIFQSSVLLAGKVNPGYIHLQLSRWVKAGRIFQLRRGLYTIAPPYLKISPHPFLIANRLQRSSYVSMQSALAFYGLIPENVNLTISVTAGRPEQVNTPLGTFSYRHEKSHLLFGYRLTDLGGQQAFIATPEKALLDLLYHQPRSQSKQYLGELRLQNLDRLDMAELIRQSKFFASPKMDASVKIIIKLAKSDAQEYEDL